ncbi:kinase-like domain-containing protein [Rostrohypoxylon terebratum]|nr:kinase-like domain-containing protein [Rostrohypoxylon terebratum]
MAHKLGDNGFVFPESRYFTSHMSPGEPMLPTPAQVRALGHDPANPDTSSTTRPPPVKIPSLSLLVKYGSQVSIAEAECLLLVRKHLPSVPVPEVYGWCNDQNQTFIYMELVEGRTLEDAWDYISEDERISICSELQGMVSAWRQLSQKLFSESPYIGKSSVPWSYVLRVQLMIEGHVGQRPLLDWIWVSSCAPTAGPFEGVCQFHDWFTTSFKRRRNHSDLPQEPHPYRAHLPDDVPIVFTHADLHPSNIMISHQPPTAARVVSVIDWQQAGWYPAYWEYCKSRWSWSNTLRESWPDKYLPLVLEPCTHYDYWDYFVGAYGV